MTQPAVPDSDTPSPPPARGQGIGTAAAAALAGRLAAAPGIRQLTAVTGARNTASSLRLLEGRGFRIAGLLPETDEVRCTLSRSLAGDVRPPTSHAARQNRNAAEAGSRANHGTA